MSEIRILLADDHTLFREGLAALLSGAPGLSVVAEAEDGDEALRLICEAGPDVAILDVSMPLKSGLEVLDEVSARDLGVRCLLLTMHADAKLARRALSRGAAGFLPKDSAFDELVGAVEAVARGGVYLSPMLAAAVLEAGGQGSSPWTELSPREREVLGLIAEGLTTRAVAERLFISPKTVETHRARIMRKLDVHSTAELVRYAIRAGLA